MNGLRGLLPADAAAAEAAGESLFPGIPSTPAAGNGAELAPPAEADEMALAAGAPPADVEETTAKVSALDDAHLAAAEGSVTEGSAAEGSAAETAPNPDGAAITD